jgi:hypothetical protein
VFWAKTIRDEFSPPDTAADPAGPQVAALAGPAGAAGGGVGQEADQAEPEDEDLAAYNAYLTRLQEQVKNHGRWHGLR